MIRVSLDKFTVTWLKVKHNKILINRKKKIQVFELLNEVFVNALISKQWTNMIY